MSKFRPDRWKTRIQASEMRPVHHKVAEAATLTLVHRHKDLSKREQSTFGAVIKAYNEGRPMMKGDIDFVSGVLGRFSKSETGS